MRSTRKMNERDCSLFGSSTSSFTACTTRYSALGHPRRCRDAVKGQMAGRSSVDARLCEAERSKNAAWRRKLKGCNISAKGFLKEFRRRLGGWTNEKIISRLSLYWDINSRCSEQTLISSGCLRTRSQIIDLFQALLIGENRGINLM